MKCDFEMFLKLRVTIKHCPTVMGDNIKAKLNRETYYMYKYPVRDDGVRGSNFQINNIAIQNK